VVTDQNRLRNPEPVNEVVRVAPTDDRQLTDPRCQLSEERQRFRIHLRLIRIGDDRGQGPVEVEAQDRLGKGDIPQPVF